MLDLVNLDGLSLERLVVLEEALKHQQSVRRQIGGFSVGAEFRVVDGDRDDLVIHPAAVHHGHQAYRSGAHEGERYHRLLAEHQAIERIVVFGQGLRDEAGRLREELAGRFYVDEEDFLYAVKSERSFNLIDDLELAKVDLFCVAPRGYQAEALERAETLELERDDPFTAVRVASAADVLLSKLRWYRLGQESSDRQWRDVLGVARAQAGRLDLPYLRRWSREQGTIDLLERVLAEAGAT